MRYIKISLFVAAILFINILFFIQVRSSYSNWSQSTVRFSIEQIYDLPVTSIKPFNLPGRKSGFLCGSIARISVSPLRRELLFFSPFRKSLIQVKFLLHKKITEGWTLFDIMDVNGDGQPELPLLGTEKRKIVMELQDVEKNITRRQILEDLSIKVPSAPITLIIKAIDDIDNDGRKELVWTITGDWEGLPRGVAVHDLFTGGKKWEFLFGGTPSGTIVKDINHDGKKEIIFSAWAPHNDLSYNGMSSDTSYVGVLDCRGNLLWRNIGGGIYSKLYIAVEDLDKDGKFEVITARKCHREIEPDPGQIQVYDALTGETIIQPVHYPGLSFASLYVTDIDNDDDLEIITNDATGGLRIWDHKLKLCEEYKHEKMISILGVEKINKKSTPLIFTWTSFQNLRIFDNRLRTVFNYEFTKEFRGKEPIVPVSDGENIFFILTTDRTYLVSPKHASTFKEYLRLLRSSFSLYLLGILVFNGLIYMALRQRERLRAHYLKLIKEGAKPQWMDVAQEVLHKMKSPLTNILWKTEKIDQLLDKKRQLKSLPSRLKKENKAILADVNELKLMNSFLMKFLRVQALQLQETAIKKILMDLVEKYRNIFSSKISFACNISDSLPSFLADEEQLTEAFSIIMDNAVDAVPDEGTISIIASYYKILPGKSQKNIICVEIEDNGHGIPQNQLNKIFDLHYTTKEEGTGIGLTIAKRIIESHDGWIEVESREKVGTKFALYFPVKNLPAMQ
jgi:signal transduction histidine kinase